MDAHVVYYRYTLALELVQIVAQTRGEGWGTSRVTYVREHNGMERMAATITVNNSHS